MTDIFTPPKTDAVSQFIAWLSGKKTYAIALLLGLVTMLKYLGKIDTLTADTWTNILLGGGLMALRDGVANAMPKSINFTLSEDGKLGQ